MQMCLQIMLVPKHVRKECWVSFRSCLNENSLQEKPYLNVHSKKVEQINLLYS